MYRIHVIFSDGVENYFEHPTWDAALSVSYQIEIENPKLMEIQVNCPRHGWTTAKGGTCDKCDDDAYYSNLSWWNLR